MIEQLLTALVEAIRENTNALRAIAGNAEQSAAGKPRGRPAAAKTETPAPNATPEPAAVQAAVTAPTQQATAQAGTVSFKEAADALVSLAEGVSRDAAVALLAEFKVSKAPELKPTDYAAFVEKAKAQLAAKTAPASGAAGLV